jgi:hypothetical protein
MKRTILPAILLCFCINASAQVPTLTSSSNPIIGGKCLLYTTDSFNVGSSGAGVTWNFSTLTIKSTDTAFYSACSVSSHCSSFPATTMYVHGYTNPNELFFNNSSTKMSLIGAYTIAATSYTNYEDMFRYPFTYNTTYVDTFIGGFVSMGYTYYRKGTITVTGDAYGTLILPNATFTNALRVHRMEAYSDSTYISGFPFVINYSSDIYTWYVPGGREAVLSQTKFFASGTGSPKTAFYTGQTPSTIGINNVQNTVTALQLYPNPATDKLHAIFSTAGNGHVRISLTDMPGREVAVIINKDLSAGGQQVDLSTADIPRGLYLLKLQADGETITRKIELR